MKAESRHLVDAFSLSSSTHPGRQSGRSSGLDTEFQQTRRLLERRNDCCLCRRDFCQHEPCPIVHAKQKLFKQRSHWRHRTLRVRTLL